MAILKDLRKENIANGNKLQVSVSFTFTQGIITR